MKTWGYTYGIPPIITQIDSGVLNENRGRPEGPGSKGLKRLIRYFNAKIPGRTIHDRLILMGIGFGWDHLLDGPYRQMNSRCAVCIKYHIVKGVTMNVMIFSIVILVVMIAVIHRTLAAYRDIDHF